jgi:hypothetical protein
MGKPYLISQILCTFSTAVLSEILAYANLIFFMGALLFKQTQ